MKFFKFILLFYFCKNVNSMRNQLLLENFNDFMIDYNKTYPTQAAKDEAFENFRIEKLLCMEQELKFYANESTFLMNINVRSDESLAKKATWRGLKQNENDPGVFKRQTQPEFPPAPDSIDYRDLGLVTDVVDQGYYCGSCYAFGAVCALEAQLAKKNGFLTKLSEQNIVDCSRNFGTGNWGCDGGYIEASYYYVIANQGIQTDESYPYVGFESPCTYNYTESAGGAINFRKVIGDEEHLKRAVAAIGPVVVGIKADLYSFYDYYTGVYDDPECTASINHIVTIVGYGTDSTFQPPQDYWIIKNSWSDMWGENGYMRMKRGVEMCGITQYAFYPEV